MASLALLGTAAHAADTAATYRWLQYTPSGLEVRAITPGTTCPSVVFGNGSELSATSTPMAIRASPSRGFPVTVCSIPFRDLQSDSHSISIDGVPLAEPSSRPRRLAVIGDTGCRLKGFYLQACNDPKYWPFAQIAAQVAREKPDLVIHVGDYNYRETPCPPIMSGCAGSPWGDTWDVWRADFYEPAQPLLEAAPWVFVRGNHEECARAGAGWTRFMAPGAYPAGRDCVDQDAPFTVRLPGLTLAVLDVATASENFVNAAQAKAYRDQYLDLGKGVSGPIWILQHRPIWGPGGTIGPLKVGDSRTLAVAATGALPANVTAILSGHHHLFEVLSFGGALPVQIVGGNSGDFLNSGKVTARLDGWSMAPT